MRFTGDVQRFHDIGGWYYVDLPAEFSAEFEHGRFIPVVAEVGGLQWETSVMPKGDGGRIVALKAAVRKATGLEEGDQVTLAIRRR